MAFALYIASIFGAISLLLMMPRPGGRWPVIGGVLGAATLGGIWLFLSGTAFAKPLGIEPSAMAFYYIFSSIAIIAAVRVITHNRSVYAALWFVMVVIATAGLFLTLGAQFIAFAMIIIYGGAILVTYMFVIMLASKPTSDDSPESQPEYDRLAREPVLAVTAGFFLLALLLNVMFQYKQMQPYAPARGLADSVILHGGTNAKGTYVPRILGHRQNLRKSQAKALAAAGVKPGESLSYGLGPGNHVMDIERIGLNLFRGHPLGIELSGVILLVSLIGAVVIAKTHVEEEDDVLSPEERRAMQTQTRPAADRETAGSNA